MSDIFVVWVSENALIYQTSSRSDIEVYGGEVFHFVDPTCCRYCEPNFHRMLHINPIQGPPLYEFAGGEIDHTVHSEK